MIDQRDRAEIERLTEEYGGQWGINHTRRLLQLIAIIGEGHEYDADVVWLAAHLHDWGAYGPWPKAGVDHAVRSKQVAEPFLREQDFPPELIELVLECIEQHHQGGANRRIESILLSDADALDFLGAVGVLRDFSKKPNDLRAAYKMVRTRMEKLPKMICLAKTKEIAAKRLQEMESLLAAFEAETFGCF
ncbi:MAG: HD domain-containing protein [Anaerolineaceae bacterium]|nr:HD domain-containing protein [Anaerolineaceae bacterium]